METESRRSQRLKAQSGIVVRPAGSVSETRNFHSPVHSLMPRPMVVTLLGMLSETSLVLRKAHSPILVTPFGMLMETRELHPSNAWFGISVCMSGQFTWPAWSGCSLQPP